MAGVGNETADSGYVYETEAEGVNSLIESIYFKYATSVDDVCAVAYAIDSEGNATRDTTVINANNLTYNHLTGMWSCLCPFKGCVKWKLFIWKRNNALSGADLSWKSGDSIPVSKIVDEINLVRARIKAHTTNVSRALRVPETGSDAYVVPPKEARAGKILGFDDDGNPACGKDVQQVVDFFNQEQTCKEYMDAAAASAQSAANSATAAAISANEARDSMNTAEDWADKSQLYANDALGSLQKIDSKAATAKQEIEQTAAAAKEEVSGLVKTVVSRAEAAAEYAAESAEAASASSDSANVSYSKCLSLVQSISQGLRIKVVSALPETGETGVFYFVGNDETGYEQYIWSDTGEASSGSSNQSWNDVARVWGYYGTFDRAGLSGGYDFEVNRSGFTCGETELNPSGTTKLWQYWLVYENGAWAIAAKSSSSESLDKGNDNVAWWTMKPQRALRAGVNYLVILSTANTTSASAAIAASVEFRAKVNTELSGGLREKAKTGTAQTTAAYMPAFSLEYVSLTRGYFHVGSSDFSALRPMTSEQYGLGKTSTDEVLTADSAGKVGMNGSGQLLVPVATTNVNGVVKTSTETVIDNASEDYTLWGGLVGKDSLGRLMTLYATLDRPGAVKLGSQFQSTHAGEYVVGIAASSNPDKLGQLAFNLKETQSDGSPGVLRYERKDPSDLSAGWQLTVSEGSYTQMGVLKMLHSLVGYSDEEIEACRETHAASVGLVIDGLEEFCTWFFTDERIYGYFDEWAKGKNLADAIWSNPVYREALFENVGTHILDSSIFDGMLTEKVNAKTLEWLTGTITDAYIDDMFAERVIAKTVEIADAHWTDDLDKAIDESTTRAVGEQLEPAIRDYYSKKENVKSIADIVVSAISDSVSDDVEQNMKDYVKSVLDGKTTIMVGEESMTFTEWASKEIQKLVNSQTAGIEAKLQIIRNSISNVKKGNFGNWTKIIDTSNYEDILHHSFPEIADYDVILIDCYEDGSRTGKCFEFFFDVWRIKHAIEKGHCFEFITGWGFHDDDFEWDGSQISIEKGYRVEWHAGHNGIAPMAIYGANYL